MENLSDNKLWRPCDEEGTRLFTKIPNILLKEFLSGKYTQNEIKIMLFICRMSFGMKGREETNYLSYEDISHQTEIARTHISTQINKLIDKKSVFRSVKSGSKYRFAINMLRFGVQMKYYRIWNLDNGISTKEYIICNDVYGICTSEANENLVIVYNSNSYSNQEKAHRNYDRNLDRKKDKACTTNGVSSDTTSKSVLEKGFKQTTIGGTTYNSVDEVITGFEEHIRTDIHEDNLWQFMKALPQKEHYRLREAYLKRFNYEKNNDGTYSFIQSYEKAERKYLDYLNI